jgi:hypothetical protein
MVGSGTIGSVPLTTLGSLTGRSQSSFQNSRHSRAQPSCAEPSQRSSRRCTAPFMRRTPSFSTTVRSARVFTWKRFPQKRRISGMNGIPSSVPRSSSVARISASPFTSTHSPGRNRIEPPALA